jgi:UDPglucose--hexose-1-phosphate uridylyltransferase
VIAPGRGRRPGTPSPIEEAAPDETGCPFCEGHEAETPPEAFAVAGPGRQPDAPGWRVRVVPNLYPAVGGEVGRQEVVVHSPRHARSLAELAAEELADVATAWQARAAAARDAGYAYVHAFLNEGRSAGASQPHSHSQLVWLRSVPPGAAQELDGEQSCRLCEALAAERAGEARLVLERDGLLLLCPYASRGPYELLVAAASHEPDAFSAGGRLADGLTLLAEGIRRLRSAAGFVPLNAWLHTSAFGGRQGHWHIELVPRTAVWAGLELGAGIYVNPLPPEQAAETLRAAGRPEAG